MNKNQTFKNQIVLVVGGSKGIGRSISTKFAERGAKVYFTSRKKDRFFKSLKSEKFSSGGQTHGIISSLRSESQINTLLKKIKKKDKHVNILINNVGDAIKRTSFVSSSDELWLQTINTNLLITIRTTRLFLKLFKKTTKKSIVNIGSVAGRSGGEGDSLHYGTSKAALHVFSTGLAKELKNTRVNCVAPSIIDTNFQKRLSSKKRLKKIIASTPAKRIGTPDEVANVVTFLSSKEASYINGEVVVISGGR
ncbi:MAG: SDR family NAD(P)-dependent oxidoreductase [Pelagibacteraceae bacterium]